MFKSEIRIIGWDDAAFSKDIKPQKVKLVGAIIRGGDYIDGLLTTEVEYDGLDSTQKIASSVLNSRHRDQLRAIMTDGITFAGFNLVDIKALNQQTGLPVIAVLRANPQLEEFMAALRRYDDFEQRKKIVEKAGPIHSFGKIFFQFAGISRKEAEEIIRLSTTRGNIPEPLRAAHLIASGLSGESSGRA